MNMHLMLLATNLVYLRRSLGVPALVCALAILLAFLPAAPADAGLNEWTTNGPASSGPILSLAVDPSAPETVYAGSGISGMLAGTVFKSTNGGVSWVPANSGLPSVFARSLVIDPQTPSRRSTQGQAQACSRVPTAAATGGRLTAALLCSR
jgi:hypothetical protein